MGRGAADTGRGWYRGWQVPTVGRYAFVGQRAPTNPAYSANNCWKYRFVRGSRMTPFPWLTVEDMVGPRVAAPPPERPHGRAAWCYWALGRLQGGDAGAARVWQSKTPTDQRSAATSFVAQNQNAPRRARSGN